MNANHSRNEEICRLLANRRLSYAVIGETVGVSRNVVAGIAFRQKHMGTNKIGHGFQAASYYPEKTAQNTR